MDCTITKMELANGKADAASATVFICILRQRPRLRLYVWNGQGQSPPKQVRDTPPHAYIWAAKSRDPAKQTRRTTKDAKQIKKNAENTE